MKFEIEQQLLQNIANYFAEKPEVQLLNAIQTQAKPIPEKQEAKEDGKVDDSKAQEAAKK